MIPRNSGPKLFWMKTVEHRKKETIQKKTKAAVKRAFMVNTNVKTMQNIIIFK